MNDYFQQSLMGVPLFSFICAGAGAYLGGYLKRRGQNLATKEDFNDLKSQTAELRNTTKEIEAKIEDQVWNRQRLWEMKRDMLLGFLPLLRDFEQAELRLSIAMKSLHEAKQEKRAEAGQRRDKMLSAFEEASAAYERVTLQTSLVVDKKTRTEIMKMSTIVRDIVGDVLSGKDVDAHIKRNSDIALQFLAVENEIRRELGLPPLTD